MAQTAQPSLQDPTSGNFAPPPQGPQPTVSKPSFLQAMDTGAGGLPNAASPQLTKGGKLLAILGAAAKGGLAGFGASQEGNPRQGYGHFGAGFEAGSQLPFIQAQQKQQLQAGQLKNQQTAAQTQYLPQILGANLGKTQAQTSEANAKASVIPQKQTLAEDATKHRQIVANRKLGLDENGDALKYEDMSPTEQAHADFLEASTEQKAAATALAKFKSDPNSPQYRQAAQRLQIAQQNADTAAGKLGLQRNEYKANYLGTDANNNPLPGGPTSEDGKPVGVRVANAGAASGKRLDKGDLAVSVHENTASIRQILARRPDLVGALQGRYTTFQQMIGNDDADISALGTAGHNAALAATGIHGTKSSTQIAATEQSMLNHFKNGPKAIGGGLDEMDKSVQTFIDAAHRGKKPSVDPTRQAPNNGTRRVIDLTQ